MRVALLLLSLACSIEQPASRVEDGAGSTPGAKAPGTSTPGASTVPAAIPGAAAGGPAAIDAHDHAAAPHDAPVADAVAANTRGYRAYQKGDLVAALDAFRQAIALDDDYALAHYNLACTLALLRRQGQVCPYDATEPAILDHLERAVALDSGRQERMRQDGDLDDLRDTIRYRILDGADPSTDAGLRAVLEGVELFGPPQGVYGALSRLRLETGGHALVGQRLRGADGVPGDWKDHDAIWSVADGVVHIDDSGDIQDLRLSADGSLRAGDSRDAGGQALWTDSPPECAA